MKYPLCVGIVHLQIGMRVKSLATNKAENVGQESGIILKICVVLEDHQEGHNSIVVEVEGDIFE